MEDTNSEMSMIFYLTSETLSLNSPHEVTLLLLSSEKAVQTVSLLPYMFFESLKKD